MISKSSTTNILTICTWNLHLGLDLKTVINSLLNHPDFKTVDIFIFQEASLHKHQGIRMDDAQQIAQALTNCWHTTFDHYQVNYNIIWNWFQGNAFVWNTHTFQVQKKTSFVLPRWKENSLGKYERIGHRIVPAHQRDCICMKELSTEGL